MSQNSARSTLRVITIEATDEGVVAEMTGLVAGLDLNLRPSDSCLSRCYARCASRIDSAALRVSGVIDCDAFAIFIDAIRCVHNRD
jgi:hypothetical protein